MAGGKLYRKSYGKCSCVILIFLFTFSAGISYAQHDYRKMEKDTIKMTSSFSPNLPMSRDGSGTGWQPDISPLMMYIKKTGSTTLMFHGSVFIRYTSHDIKNKINRKEERYDAPSWMMFVIQQKVSSRSLVSFHSMFSLDRLTTGTEGYPLMFQAGETHDGIPLIHRQHPHDLFSALAVNYTYSISKNVDLNAYFGYPGEPALGPVAFMHRLSAANNPDVPLGHHRQDATHITFGVGTFGVRYKMYKLEGSIFTGREPDENRYNFDKPLFDSYSYRLSINPGQEFSLQYSQALIKESAAQKGGIGIERTTLSVIHTRQLTRGRFIATSIIWGSNRTSITISHLSLLLECNLHLHTISPYIRYEFVQRDAEELQLIPSWENPEFVINTLTFGVNKTLFTSFKTAFSLGAQGTVNLPDERLKSVYGNNILSAEVYLKISPPPLSHNP